MEESDQLFRFCCSLEVSKLIRIIRWLISWHHVHLLVLIVLIIVIVQRWVVVELIVVLGVNVGVHWQWILGVRGERSTRILIPDGWRDVGR